MSANRRAITPSPNPLTHLLIASAAAVSLLPGAIILAPTASAGPDNCPGTGVFEICLPPWPGTHPAPAAGQPAPANAPQAPGAPAHTSTVLFELTGSGEVYSIYTLPSTDAVPDHTAVPWQRTITVAPDVKYLQVNAAGRTNPGPGCRITLDGKVVAEKSTGHRIILRVRPLLIGE